MKKKLAVLMVEDSSDDEVLLLRFLERSGFDIHSLRVETEADFVAALGNPVWEIIVCDYAMPHFSGTRALQIVQDRRIDIPFIFVSGTIGEDAAVNAMRAGAHDYVVKGNLDRLFPAIERELREVDVRRKQRVAEAELRLRNAALEAAANAILITDDAGTILWANPAFQVLTGYTMEEAMGHNPGELLKSGHHTSEFYREMWETILSGQVWRGEMINRRKDGSTYHEEMTISPLPDETGRITRFIAVKQDITKRHAAEEALRESEERYRMLIDSAEDGIFTIDAQGILVSLNPAFDRVTGWSREEWIGKSFTELVYAEDLAIALETFSKVMSGQVISHVELRVRNKNHGYSVADIRLSPLTKDGKIIGIFGISRDVTQRKQAEVALKKTEERYRTFFENDLSGDYVSTPDGYLIDCNSQFAKILGYDRVEDALHMDVHSLYTRPEERQQLIQRLRVEKRIENLSTELRKRDGSPAYVIEKMIGYFDDDGELVQIIGYLIDETQMKSLERQLIQAQKLESLGTLAGGIAHDFNNILGIILGHISLIKRKFPSDEYIASNSDTIISTTQRGAALVRQLLTFARKADVSPGTILLHEIAMEIKKLLDETFPKIISIDVHYPKDLPPIVADATQMHQVLLNLCVNARDAMPSGGRISIHVDLASRSTVTRKFPNARASEYILVRVTDTGQGMDEETRNHIFEPFFTTKERDKGTGLGLSVVYGIIEAHQGFIDVESEPGRGATFEVFLPVHQRFATPPRLPPDIATSEGGHETILVVDDEELMSQFLTMLLREKGYEVLTAGDGPSALEIYTKYNTTIALVFTDMGLPGMTGLELLKDIRQVNPKAKVIMASGYFEIKERAELIELGAADLLQKPLTPDVILAKIREVLDRR